MSRYSLYEDLSNEEKDADCWYSIRSASFETSEVVDSGAIGGAMLLAGSIFHLMWLDKADSYEQRNPDLKR